MEGNNTRKYLKRVVNQTLMGGVQRRREPEWDPDYWMKERGEVVYNRGKFSPRSWVGTVCNGPGRGEDTDMGLDLADLQNEGVLVVDIDDNVDSSETRYQGNAVPQRYECQPVPAPANQYRWFPDK